MLRKRLNDVIAQHDEDTLAVDRLRLTLASGTARLDRTVADLGLAPGHPRFVGDLPSDEVRLGVDPRRPGDPRSSPRDVRSSPTLAGSGDPGFLVPLALGPVAALGSRPLDPRPEADTDGLRSMTVDRFVDPRVADVDPARLIAEADFLRYQSPTPTTLRGIHALLGVDEVTLIAVPDAALPGWADEVTPNAPLPDRPAPPTVPPETFELCDPGAPSAPDPRIEWPESGTARFRVAWPPVPHADRYVIQETTEPATWSPPVEVIRQRPRLEVTDPTAGVHRYRVRGVNEHGEGPWSGWVTATVPGRTEATPEPSSNPASTLDLHAALLRMCAARGDMVALLSVPALATPDQVLEHVTALRDCLAPPGPPGRAGYRRPTPTRSASSASAPCTTHGSSRSPTRRPRACGAAGMRCLSARRARPRPPARRRRPLGPSGATRRMAPSPGCSQRGRASAVRGSRPRTSRSATSWRSTTRSATTTCVRLHAAGVNVVRRLPSGFLVLGCPHPQRGPDPAHDQRAPAARASSAGSRCCTGPSYVFEPNSDAFRRTDPARIRGHPRVPVRARRVRRRPGRRRLSGSVGDPPNSPQSVDAGRLIVDLQVAPSAPLEFLTVRMVRSGDRFAIEGP